MAGTGTLAQGSVGKTLMRFAWPFLVSNFLQALYGSVDLAVVGWFGDASGISAVSIGGNVLFLVNSLIVGLTMGGTVLLAQYLGAGREEDARQTIGTMFTMFGFVGAGIMALMYAFAPFLLRLLNTPAQAMAQAIQYVRICALGIVFIFAYNAISAILRGMGDSKSPMRFIAVACCANILLDFTFVGGLGWGAAGAAAATVVSQGLSALLAVRDLRHRDFLFDFKASSFRIQRAKALTILRLGLPISLQECMVSVSFLVITAIVNDMGLVASAAVGIAGKFENFAMLPASALSGAISAIAAQNIGAHQPERARKSLWMAIGFAFGCSLFFFGWAQLAPLSILSLFGAGQEVALAGAQYLSSFSFDFMLVAFAFTLGGFFSGCGRTTFTMLNGVISSLLIRVPVAFVMSREIGRAHV